MKKLLFATGKGFEVVSAEINVRSNKTWWLRIWDAWDWLNDVAFHGELTKPKIEVWANLYQAYPNDKNKKYRLNGCFLPDSNKILLWYKGEAVLQTLYHEMVHQHMWEVVDEYIGHGSEFWYEYGAGMERINKHLRKKCA